MIISYIECYRNKVIRTEMDSEPIINVEEESLWTCNFYDDVTKKLVETFEDVYPKSTFVSDIQENFNTLFFERHTEYKRKSK